MLNDTKLFTNKLLSDTKVISGGYYYGKQGDQLGIGPVPPVADIPTSYWIFWEVDNAGNDLSDFTMSAQLPENIIFTDNKTLSAGDLEYSLESKKVSWKLSQVQKEGEISRVGFEISYTPNTSEVGKIKELITDVNYSYNDSFCGVIVADELQNINTRLSDDKNILSDGVVQNLSL